MATTSRGFNVPEGGDSNDVPGDLLRLTDSIIPALTTAQIDALSWTDKPAGWIAYDTTKLRAVISTGAAMVNVIDARGGTLTEATAGGLRLFVDGTYRVVETVDAANVRIKAGTTILTVTHNGVVRSSRTTDAGDFSDTLTTKGYVDARTSSRILAGVFTGTANANGDVTVSLGSVPAGCSAWSVVATPVTNPIGFQTCEVLSVSSSSVTVRCYTNAAPFLSGSVTFHWQAIAY